VSLVIAVPTALTGRTTREQAAIAMLAIGGTGTAFFSVLAMRAEGEAAVPFDNVQQLVAIVAAIGALLIVRPNADGEQRRVHGTLAVALALGSIGFLIWDSVPSPTAASITADAFFLAATVLAVVGVGTTIFRGLDRPMVAAVALDTLIFVLGVITAVLMVWNRNGGPAGGDASPSALVGAVVLYSAAAAGVIGLIARRIKPSVRGPWSVVVGVYAIGSSWLFWLDGAARGGGSLITPADFLFSVGVLIAAFGGVTWATSRSVSPIYEQVARRAADLFPILAVVAAATLELVPRRTSGIDEVTLVATGTMLAAMARQVLLLQAERHARDAERRVSSRLAREIEERAATIVMLSRLEPGDTPEATAQRICEEALRLDGIDFAVVRAFDSAGRVIPLANAGMDLGGSLALGEPIDAARGAITVERAVAGPWVEILAPDMAVPHLRALHGSGLRGTANAPMRWEDTLIGAVGLGTSSEETAAWLSERLPMVREFGVVAAGLLGPALAARERRAQLRLELQGVIDQEAFRPVFQVVKELATGRVIGFEALTRFADGTPPDLKFQGAVAAGLGLELEQACLTASIRAATALPPGAWLSLNVSPALALAAEPLVALIRTTDREIVLEITEHAPIEDYPRLAGALVTLRHHARLAVDDAGAGYAGLRHILEVQPQFVKLDISLVRAVDKDAARRAMIGGMIAFARDAGCALIAEGIETPGELATLQALGVGFGQGYLLGRPAPVEAIDAARPARRLSPASAGLARG
jgi:EAL domain-containing protein (putative c-di-GMP-specific phosphodiesterase class I)